MTVKNAERLQETIKRVAILLRQYQALEQMLRERFASAAKNQVILNRDSFSPGFNQLYSEYATGFGPRSGDYYLGNDALHALTSALNYKLRVDIVRPNGTAQFAEYTTFKVASPDNRYTLTVGGYSGDAGDALVFANGQAFSTIDNVAGPIFAGSALYIQGGFWLSFELENIFTSVTGNPGGAYGQFTWGPNIDFPIEKARLSLERL